MDLVLIVILVIGFFIVERGFNKICEKFEELLDYLKEKFGETGDEFEYRMETEWQEEQKHKDKK
jgi:hypothetical protein